MAITRKKNLGLLLIEAGIIEPEQLEQALLKQAKEANSGYIGDILISAGLILSLIHISEPTRPY